MGYILMECDGCNTHFNRSVREFNKSLKEGYKLTFCSNRCRGLFQSKRVERQCANCGSQVLRRTADLKKTDNSFCSTRCSAKFNNGLRKGNPLKSKKTCRVCLIEFLGYIGIPIKMAVCDSCIPKNSNRRTRRKALKREGKYVLPTSNRKKDHKCIKCSIDVKSHRKYCDPCLKERQSELGKRQATNRRSKNEILFASMCKEKFSTILENPKMFNGWDADVVIEDLKIAVLWNGQWHYRDKIKSNHSLVQTQNRDKFKAEHIKNAGYKLFVVKDMGKYSPKFVEEKFEEFLKFLSR